MADQLLACTSYAHIDHKRDFYVMLNTIKCYLTAAMEFGYIFQPIRYSAVVTEV